MTRLALLGYGKMGKRLEELASEHGFTVVLRIDSRTPFDRQAYLEEGVEVAVDFSIPAAVVGNVERMAALGIPLVVGTTGWAADLGKVRAAVERHGSALLYGANFSVGVQIFYRLVAEAARRFAADPAYDAWAYEIHHRHKKDAPSGTLLRIVETARGAGFDRPIDVASNRAGAIPGSHLLGFDSPADTILLEHRARNRDGLALGALRAAAWIRGRKGVYEFSEVWEEMMGSSKQRELGDIAGSGREAPD
jgi:4-hydroxy-tetrahydrodipicolinate reductase